MPSPIWGFIFSGNSGNHALHLNPHEVGGSLRHGDDLPPARVILSSILSLSNQVLRAAVWMEAAPMFVPFGGMNRFQGINQDVSSICNWLKVSQ